MIVQERFTVDEREFIRTFSDSWRYVVRDGVSYSEACDPAELNRQYTEGDLFPEEERYQMIEDVLNILVGVSE